MGVLVTSALVGCWFLRDRLILTNLRIVGASEGQVISGTRLGIVCSVLRCCVGVLKIS